MAVRTQQAELRVAKRERNAGALNRELGAASAKLEALKDRARILEEQLAARAAEAQQSAALAVSGALLQERSQASRHCKPRTLMADRQRLAAELLELEHRVQDSETCERQAQQATEAQSRNGAELAQRMQDETRLREQVSAERERLRAQLASCLERLQNRDAYRSICESTIGEVDEEFADRRAVPRASFPARRGARRRFRQSGSSAPPGALVSCPQTRQSRNRSASSSHSIASRRASTSSSAASSSVGS
jgi:hypothetical protein